MHHQTIRDFALPPTRAGRSLLLAALLMSCAALATASSPDAWAAHDKEVAAACVQASTLQKARVAGQPVVFDDRTAMTALLISGTYPQRRLKNRSGRELCLFNRTTRQAVVSPADQFSLTVRAAQSPK